jgi:transketolase C-terminal domain/subunit
MGGLGEGVAAVLAQNHPCAMVIVGVEDEFSQSGKVTPEKDDLKIHLGWVRKTWSCR